MATDTLTRISPYAERLLDDYIYDELDDAGKKLRAAYTRVSRRPRKAIDDPRVVRLVRDAGESIRNAAVAAAGREPEPPSRLPRILAALAITGTTAFFVKRLASGPPAKPEAQ
jgi:hypothetical protein